MRRISEAETLQAAAVIVAAPRYMGAFAYALGIILPDAWRWFAPVEIWSGLAMAILEGWAIAYISRHWRIAQGNPRRVLLAMQIALLVLLPTTATPYLFGAEVGLKSLEIMPVWLVWLWKLAVAGITPLVVLAVGYASGRKATGQAIGQHQAKKRDNLIAPAIRPAGKVGQRQTMVGQLTRQGLTIGQIADKLGVSQTTIKNDRRAIREANNVHPGK